MLPRSRTVKALLLCVALAFTTLLFAEPIKKLQPTGYVDDFAHVIDPASRQAIEHSPARLTTRPARRLPWSLSARSMVRTLKATPPIFTSNGASGPGRAIAVC